MRRLFTSDGRSRAAMRWGERTGKWRHIEGDWYADGPDDPSQLDRARALALRTNGVASGPFAGMLLELDNVSFRTEVSVPPGQRSSKAHVRRRVLASEHIIVVKGVRCTDGWQTLVDLAATLDDVRWEQALESALRKKLVTVAALETALPALGAARTPGVARMRRVLQIRPPGAPPTESLLETLMVQLVRTIPGLPPPTRQQVIRDSDGSFVARVDLSWPVFRVFVELDGEWHKGQPVYDAQRQTAVIVATGWLCGRFTWTQLTRYPNATRRQLIALIERSRAA